MHRLLVSAADLGCEEPSLNEGAARHLRVLRPKDGEEVELFDGAGKSRVYRYDAGRRGLVASADVVESARRDGLILFACVTKGSRWDWTIEKATELGVTRIVPVISERTIVRIREEERAGKRERWMRIAEDAARQSDAKWLPEIDEAVDFRGALEIVKGTRCFVGALTKPMPPTILRALEAADLKESGKALAMFVGPEGDFTPEELAALLEIATPVSFGETILRAETAAIYGVSILRAVIDARVS